jgi:hypothetical protein
MPTSAAGRLPRSTTWRWCACPATAVRRSPSTWSPSRSCHSAYSRGVVLSVRDTVALEILPTSGRLAVEVDGQVGGYVEPGDRIDLRARPGAARVVRLGMTTFYQRARRKLRLTDSAEIPPAPHLP